MNSIFGLFTDQTIRMIEFERKVSKILKNIVNVILFLKNEENIVDSDEVVFIHDNASYMPANQTQHLFQDNGVKFRNNDI